MPDLNRNKQASSVISITGEDELHKADVINDSDGLNKLLVKTDSIVSSDLGIVLTNPNTTITDSWITLLNRNTTTRMTVSGIIARFNSPNVEIRMYIDGNLIFELRCDWLDDIADVDQANIYGNYVYWNNSRDSFHFAPNFPIISYSNVTIEARKVSGGNKTLSYFLTQIGEVP